MATCTSAISVRLIFRSLCCQFLSEKLEACHQTFTYCSPDHLTHSSVSRDGGEGTGAALDGPATDWEVRHGGSGAEVGGRMVSAWGMTVGTAGVGVPATLFLFWPVWVGGGEDTSSDSGQLNSAPPGAQPWSQQGRQYLPHSSSSSDWCGLGEVKTHFQARGSWQMNLVGLQVLHHGQDLPGCSGQFLLVGYIKDEVVGSGWSWLVGTVTCMPLRFQRIPSFQPRMHNYNPKRHNLMEGVNKCMISRQEAQAKFRGYRETLGSHDQSSPRRKCVPDVNASCCHFQEQFICNIVDQLFSLCSAATLWQIQLASNVRKVDFLDTDILQKRAFYWQKEW